MFWIHLLTLLIWWVAPEFPIIFISLFTILLEEKKIKCVSIGSQYNDIAFWRFLFETAIMDLFFRSILMMKSMAWCTLKYPLIWIMTGDCLGFINLEAGIIIFVCAMKTIFTPFGIRSTTYFIVSIIFYIRFLIDHPKYGY